MRVEALGGLVVRYGPCGAPELVQGVRADVVVGDLRRRAEEVVVGAAVVAATADEVQSATRTNAVPLLRRLSGRRRKPSWNSCRNVASVTSGMRRTHSMRH